MKDESSLYRLFAADLAAGSKNDCRVLLGGSEAHHAVHVLRLKAGAEVELFDGCGLSAVGEITAVRRSEVEVRVKRILPPAGRTGPFVHLAFAVPKLNRLDWLLEKTTELGAASLQPVVFQRSVVGREELSRVKQDRWRSVCISAAKQCGMNFLPEIRSPIDLATFLAGAACLDGVCRILGSLQASADPIAKALAKHKSCRDIIVLIGPEGGLTEAEYTNAANAGFTPVRLGQTTLRSETASVAILAVVMAGCE